MPPQEFTPSPTSSVDPPLNFLDFMPLGIASGITLVLIYLLVWWVRQRQKYIVMSPEIQKDQEAQLRGIANQFMHQFTEEVRLIGNLMQLKQVDNTHAIAGSALAHFVASGQEPEFLAELQALTSLEESGVSQNGQWLLSLLQFLVNTLAVIKVRSTIRQRADQSLEIWVELSRRRNQVVAVDQVVVSSLGNDEVDIQQLQHTAREMAIKLVLKLGQNYHLASSWQSLAYFLEGLQAATQRYCLRAVAAYRTAIQNEEAQRGSFGIGHYHLGATLLSLGELEEAIKNLEQAEISGPPVAETYYTLALAQAYRHWEKLYKEQSVFEQIERRCKRALKLRARFPEVYHLLGAIYYRKGKSLQREGTPQYPRIKNNLHDKEKEPKFTDWQQAYRQADRYFRQAIRQYEREVHQALKSNTGQGSQSELERLLQAQMTATHQLGDALRSLGLYAEADSYYEDVLMVYPDNLRTLIDRAKTYCLAGQWQRATEFIGRELLTVPEAEWNADANLYAGWALAGGVNYTLSLSKYLRKFISLIGVRELDQSEAVKLLGTATQHFDYALRQRPRYMTRWAQTDWLIPFEQVCHRLNIFVEQNENIEQKNLEQLKKAINSLNIEKLQSTQIASNDQLNEVNYIPPKGGSFDGD
jgi:tetratricopeptide (TPR) repeat protein